MSYSKEYDINYYNCDQNLDLSVVSLLRFFEDLAITHTEAVNLGFMFYEQNKVAWFLTRWLINIHSLPKFNQRIKIITNPKSFYNFYANREYQVIDETGNEIISADTLWVFIDAETRKPRKIPEQVYLGYGLNDDGRKYFSKLEEVKAFQQSDSFRNFQILRRDIDYNNHANNSQYLSYAMETVPNEFLIQHRIKKLIVNYNKEAYLNDIIKVTTAVKSEGGISYYHLMNKGNSEICKIQSCWDKIK